MGNWNAVETRLSRLEQQIPARLARGVGRCWAGRHSAVCLALSAPAQRARESARFVRTHTRSLRGAVCPQGQRAPSSGTKQTRRDSNPAPTATVCARRGALYQSSHPSRCRVTSHVRQVSRDVCVCGCLPLSAHFPSPPHHHPAARQPPPNTTHPPTHPQPHPTMEERKGRKKKVLLMVRVCPAPLLPPPVRPSADVRRASLAPASRRCGPSSSATMSPKTRGASAPRSTSSTRTCASWGT